MSRRMYYLQDFSVQIQNFSPGQNILCRLLQIESILLVYVYRYIKVRPDSICSSHMIVVMMCQQDSLRLQIVFFYIFYEFFRFVARIDDITAAFRLRVDNIAVAFQTSSDISLYLHLLSPCIDFFLLHFMQNLQTHCTINGMDLQIIIYVLK